MDQKTQRVNVDEIVSDDIFLLTEVGSLLSRVFDIDLKNYHI